MTMQAMALQQQMYNSAHNTHSEHVPAPRSSQYSPVSISDTDYYMDDKSLEIKSKLYYCAIDKLYIST